MRRRLMLLTAATTSLVLIAFVVPLGLLIRSVAADRALSAATSEAQSAASLVGVIDKHTLSITLDQLAGDPAEDYPLTVYLPGKEKLGTQAPVSDAVRQAQRGRSLTAEAPGGREVLVSVHNGHGDATVVRAFVTDHQMRAGVARSWLVLGLLAAGLFLLALFVADRMARWLIRDIDDLAGTAHWLSAGELDARNDVTDPPELAEVGHALNTLGGRISDLLTAERERGADFSHRLRTPLTLLKLEAETIEDSTDRDRVMAAATGLERSVDRAITEARRPARDAAAGGGCDASRVTRERVEFWRPLAEDEQRVMRTDLPDDPVPVRLTVEELAAALDALIGNVFAHTGEDAKMLITLEPQIERDGETFAELSVTDTGPGMPDTSQQRGASGSESTGLGLDIARSTAAASGGSMLIDTPGDGGTAVRLRLGRARELTGR